MTLVLARICLLSIFKATKVLLARTAHHFQVRNLDITCFFLAFLALLGFVLVLIGALGLELATDSHLVSDMIRQLYRGAAKVICLAVISGQAEFVSLVSLLQTAGHCSIAIFLAVLLCARCKNQDASCDDESENKRYHAFRSCKHIRTPFNPSKIKERE